jgi:hypothetical protein
VPDTISRVAELRFCNGNTAVRANEGAGQTADRLVAELGLGGASRPVIVVCGGAEEFDNGSLENARSVLGRAVSSAAGASGAVVVDGGTDSGVMSVIGKAREEDRLAMPTLVGVAPRFKVAEPGDLEPADRTKLEPSHSHFILAAGDQWGDETPLLFGVAAALASAHQVVVVLAGGGCNARREVDEAARRGWPLVVVQGFGGLGDEIAKSAARAGIRRTTGLRRIAAYDRLRVMQRDREQLADCLTWEVTGRSILKHAWHLFAAYDGEATWLQRWFLRLQVAIILLGIALTGLALAYTEASGRPRDAVGALTIVLPSVVALLVAWVGRRAFGRRWIYLRAAAEAVKAEVFRYRTSTGPYGAPNRRERVLADRLEVIGTQLSGTEALTGPLAPSSKPGPPPGVTSDSVADLSPMHYVQLRLINQLCYYRRRVREKNRRRNGLQLTILAMGGLGTVLAAFGLEPTVALTTAVSAGAVTYLALRQDEQDITTYNQATSELEATHLRWLGAEASRADPEAVEELVAATERILTEEVGAWARRMSRALAEHARQQKEHQNER